MAGQIIGRSKGVWLLRVYLGCDPLTGKRVYDNQTFHGTKKDAQTELSETLTKRDQGKITVGASKNTIGGLLDNLILDYELQGRKSVDWAKLLVEKHLKPFFGNVPSSKLNADAITRYIKLRRSQGRAAATIGNELALLRRSLNLARQSGKLHVVPFIAKPKVDNARQGFIEPEQFAKLRDAVPAHLKPLLVVGFYTGARLGELRSLRWEQVDLMAGEIRLTAAQTKTSYPRTLPIYGEMRPWLELALQDRETNSPTCPWVFQYQGRPIGAHVKGWRKASAAAGFAGLHFHDLRRSAVRNMERAGTPRHVAMAVSGHKTEAIYRRYDIVSARDLREAGKQMERYFADRTTDAGTQPSTQPETIPHTIRTQRSKGRVQ